jgi:hypothetical protein
MVYNRRDMHECCDSSCELHIRIYASLIPLRAFTPGSTHYPQAQPTSITITCDCLTLHAVQASGRHMNVWRPTSEI